MFVEVHTFIEFNGVVRVPIQPFIKVLVIFEEIIIAVIVIVRVVQAALLAISLL